MLRQVFTSGSPRIGCAFDSVPASIRSQENSMQKFVIFALAFTVAWICLSGMSFGQAVYGNIIGTVTDPSGAAVPNVSVTISDVDRGTTYQATTNASGNYEKT